LHSSAALGGLAFLAQLPPVSAADAEPAPTPAALRPEIEPLVRLIEDSPRDKLLEEVGARIKAGLAYREVLAGLLLAGVRNVPPRPSVGFKFHAVLVVNAAHQAALAAPDRERWLPLFWALDNFKSAQAQTAKEDGWRLKPIDDARVPTPEKARGAFTAAMDEWDVEAADGAAAGLVRTSTAGELFDLFARYGCRDFRDIGHKAIYVAGAFRALEVIGWQHAEPVLRSLAFALLHHDGKNPAKADLDPDRPGRTNVARAAKLAHPLNRVNDRAPDATAAVFNSLRTATADEMGAAVADRLAAAPGARGVWDGLFLGAAELLMRQPGIVSLHALTTLNALHYAFRTTGDAALRNLLLLQAAAFVPLFRDSMAGRGKLGDVKIDELTVREGGAKCTVRDVYAQLGRDKAVAARTALAVLKGSRTGAKELTDEGRRLIFLKGTDAHDYKFSSAVLEDAALMAPEWRDRFLAASVYWLKSSAAPDSPLVKRTRAALE
jgi:hypothetical protein